MMILSQLPREILIELDAASQEYNTVVGGEGEGEIQPQLNSKVPIASMTAQALIVS